MVRVLGGDTMAMGVTIMRRDPLWLLLYIIVFIVALWLILDLLSVVRT